MAYDLATPAAARLWPYPPDWSQRVVTAFEFKTDIVTARSGREQRRALRASPRRSLEFVTAPDPTTRAAANHHLRAAQNKPVAMPDWTRVVRTTATLPSAGVTVAVTSVPSWLAPGRIVMLRNGATTLKRTVAAVGAFSVTLDAPAASAWPAGTCIHPCLHGLLGPEISAARRTPAAAGLSVVMNAYPGSEPDEPTGTPWATFNGREVFALTPDWSADAGINHLWPIDPVDFGRGRTAQFRPIDAAARATEANFVRRGRTEADELIRFFCRMKGRRGAFYLPTWEKDFRLAETAAAGTDSFLAAGPDLAADFGRPLGKSSFYIAIEAGNDMAAYIDEVKPVLSDLLDEVDAAITSLGLDIDIGVTAFTETSTTAEYLNADSGDIAALKAFINGLAPAGAVDFAVAAADAMTWFDATAADTTYAQRVLLLVMQGIVTNGTDETAAEVGRDIVDHHFGRLIRAYGTHVDAFGVNIVFNDTRYAEFLDNTYDVAIADEDVDLVEMGRAFDAAMYGMELDAIVVFLTDGTQLYRNINAISAEDGDSRVLVSEPWPVDLTADNVARICWMPLSRFASDRLALEWATPSLATTRVTFQSVKV